MKPREFWIEFGGDPSDDKEVYKRYTSTAPFKGVLFSDEVVHCIEYSEYKKLKDALSIAVKDLLAMSTRVNQISEDAISILRKIEPAVCVDMIAESLK